MSESRPYRLPSNTNQQAGAWEGRKMRQVRTLFLLAGIAGATALGCGAAYAQQTLSPEGREALKAAMLDEAFSTAKYKLFAEHARRAGRNDLADLMATTSNMEYGHFLRWVTLYRLVGTDIQNLRAAVHDEINDDVQLYSRLASEADARGEKNLAEHFREVQVQEERIQNQFENAIGKTLYTQ
jgi:rubrerythrin